MFDEQYNLLGDNSGIIQSGATINQWNSVGAATPFTIGQPGYILFFTSSTMSSSVFSNNINITYYKGTVLEENHYYPFGLTLNSTPANPSQHSKHVLTTKGVQDEHGPNWYDFGNRMQDEQIGRWTTHDPLSEKTPAFSPYNYCYNNPVRKVDPTGLNPDIIFKGSDDKELRVKASGEDVHVDILIELKENRTVDIGLGAIDPKKFAFGYTVQGDVGLGFGVGGQWGAQVSVAQFTHLKYAGYNYVYAGGQSAGSVGVQVNFSASVGGRVFIGYNTDNKYDPSTFAGAFYAATWSQDLKEVVGGGYNVSAFSSTPNLTGPGWKGVYLDVSVGVGESVNLGAVGVQTSDTTLLNDVMPTSQRSWDDRLSNGVAPIPSSVATYLYRLATQ